MSRLTSLFSDPRGFILELLYLLPAIIVALSFHEWAHAYVAYRCGDPTARNLGRMTVNPVAHFDIFGFLMLALAGFGWAKPVPINPRNFSHPRRDEILVSVAGVTMNLLIAFVSLGLYYLVNLAIGWYNEIFNRLIINMVVLNLSLLVFNLIPIPPLDGYHVLQSLLIRRVGPRIFVFLERYGFIILIALLMSGVLTRYILTPAVTGILSGMEWLYLTVIGWFL